MFVTRHLKSVQLWPFDVGRTFPCWNIRDFSLLVFSKHISRLLIYLLCCDDGLPLETSRKYMPFLGFQCSVISLDVTVFFFFLFSWMCAYSLVTALCNYSTNSRPCLYIKVYENPLCEYMLNWLLSSHLSGMTHISNSGLPETLWHQW